MALVLPDGNIHQQGVPGGTEIQADLYVLNSTSEAICGVEFYLPTPENGAIQDISWVTQVVDVGSNGNHIVGFSTPANIDGNNIYLATITFIYTGQAGHPMDVFLEPATPASLPGQMAHLDCDTEAIIPLNPISQSHNLPVLSINGEELEYCPVIGLFPMSVIISTEGDPFNMAAVQDGATDGFDPGLDLPDNDPARKLYFPHAEWGYDGFFEQDIIAPFDPFIEARHWTLVYQTPPDQIQPTNVQLNFLVTLPDDSGYPVLFWDVTTGEVVNLRDQTDYIFPTSGPGNLHNFEVIIGNEPMAPFSFNISAIQGQLSDTQNQGGVRDLATDGFDDAFDFPEPAPPPTTYLSAFFHHPEWTLGPRFRTDFRAVYDPLEESKSWPFRVETSEYGPVFLNITADLGLHDEAIITLWDLSNGDLIYLDPTGTEYSYIASGSGTRDFEISVGGPQSIPPPLSPTSRELDQGWSMVGLPLQPEQNEDSLGEVIMDQAPGFVYMFQYSSNGGYEQVHQWASAQRGRGYWIATDESFDWTMSGQVLLNDTLISLDTGWNMVGFPLWFSGSLSNVVVQHQDIDHSWSEAVADGLISSGVWGFSSSEQEYVPITTLEPWHGYWIRATQSNINLVFRWSQFLGEDRPEDLDSPPLPPEQNWKTELTVTDNQGRQDKVTLGVHPDATADYDIQFDLAKPPPSPLGGPRISSHRPEWMEYGSASYITDFLPPGQEVRWITFIDPGNSDPITISWNLDNWPNEHDLQLYLPEQNRVIVPSLIEQNSFTLETDNQPLLLQLRTPDFTSAAFDVPFAGYNLRIHPNPFNPATTLSFNLPHAGQVTLRIYSIRGELVHQLDQGTLEAGPHQIIWRGKNRFGQNVPSGSYFGRLSFEGKAVGSVRKMVLIR